MLSNPVIELNRVLAFELNSKKGQIGKNYLKKF